MEEDSSNSTTESTILSALSTLTQPQLSHLTHSISSLLRLHCRRLSALLSSPTLFTLTLNHLHSISLTQKSLLLARHLLSTLSLLTHSLHPTNNNNNAVNLRHLDSTLLLLLLCEVRQHHPQALDTPLSQWLPSLSQYFSTAILSLSTLPISNDAILFQYIDLVAKCHRFVGVMGCGGGGEAAAAVAAVVGLPSVEVSGAARECVICKEEMREGRDVCELPCDHLFHWMCILPWLKKRNTCPCCRYRLPTDDVYGEIDRLWEVVVKVSGNKFIGESK